MPVLALVLGVVAFAVGVVVARAVWPPPPPPRKETMVALRHAAPGAAEVTCTLEELRALVGGELREGVVVAEVTCTLEELRALVGGELREGVVVVERGKERLRFVAPDPQRVTLAALDVFASGVETLDFDAALKLVPRFGAIRLVEELFGAFAVDGARDAAALADERGDRIRAMAAAIADDMRAKQVAYANPGAPS